MKTAIVTGANSGIGFAIAKKLVENDFNVISLDLEHSNSFFECYNIDISDTRQIEEVISKIPQIDVLVNNAGVYFEKYITETSDNDIDKMVDINIKGTYKMIRACMPKLLRRRGSIVNIASCLGLVPEFTSPLYCATKAAIIMLTKCIAGEYAIEGVRANCVLPGPIDTPLLQSSFTSEEQKAKCVKRIPLGEIGTPDDIANMVNFLVSDKAEFITGGLFSVDGGISAGSIYSK